MNPVKIEFGSRETEDYFVKHLARQIRQTSDVSIVGVLPSEVVAHVITHNVAIALADISDVAATPEAREVEQQQAATAVCALLEETGLHQRGFGERSFAANA